MNNIEEAIKDGCKNCPKKTCMWDGFVGDCPHNTFCKSEPGPREITKKVLEQIAFDKANDKPSVDWLRAELLEACKEIDRLTAEIKAKDKEITRLEGKYYRG